jgi:hypothetical protein
MSKVIDKDGHYLIHPPKLSWMGVKKYYKSTEVSKIINEPVTTLVRWYNETPDYFGEVRKYGKRNPKRYTESQVKKFKVVKFYKQTSKEKIFKLLESKI